MRAATYLSSLTIPVLIGLILTQAPRIKADEGRCILCDQAAQEQIAAATSPTSLGTQLADSFLPLFHMGVRPDIQTAPGAVSLLNIPKPSVLQNGNGIVANWSPNSGNMPLPGALQLPAWALAQMDINAVDPTFKNPCKFSQSYPPILICPDSMMPPAAPAGWGQLQRRAVVAQAGPVEPVLKVATTDLPAPVTDGATAKPILF